MKIELIYDSDCPNVPLARQRLAKALKQAKLSLAWTEWERSDPAAPSYVSRYASPSILVNGIDAGGDDSELDGQGGCRLYRGADGSIEGVPSIASIIAALQSTRAAPLSGSKSRTSLFASIGAVIMAVLPVGSCPACLPAYAGVLSSLGLSFAFDGVWSSAVLGALLAISLFTLAWKATQRNGYKPLLFGLVGAPLMILGKTNANADIILYAGSGLLILACAWNAWPRKKPLQKRACCQ